MIQIRPSCDRHKNLQMISFSIKHPTGRFHMPARFPCCNRHHDDEGYFDMVDDKPVRGEKTATGGRTSGAAAVRGDAGPDFAVTGTDGIEMLVAKSAAKSVHSGLGARRGVAKVGWNLEQFWAVRVRTADRWGCSG
jgi:hypothetical protein